MLVMPLGTSRTRRTRQSLNLRDEVGPSLWPRGAQTERVPTSSALHDRIAKAVGHPMVKALEVKSSSEAADPGSTTCNRRIIRDPVSTTK